MPSETSSNENNNGQKPVVSLTPETHTEKKLTSRYRGVCWNRKNKRWQSAINRAGRYIYLGSFVSEIEAARAFDRAAVKLRGPAAKINFAFADYQAEMTWHNQASLMGDTTELVMKQPRLLRERVHLTPFQGTIPPVVPYPQSFQRPPPCTFSPSTISPIPGTAQMNIFQGQVIGHGQGSLVQSPAGCAVYASVPCQDAAFEKCPIPAGFFMNGENGMLPTNPNPYASDRVRLSEPVVKAEPITSTPPTSADTFLPVVNMPDGAEVTQLYRGSHNAFAMGFVRKENTDTEVLLYDGRSMHEVGSFSTKDDAAQSCQALLKLLDSVKSGDSVQPDQPTIDLAPVRRPCPNAGMVFDANVVREGDRVVQYADKLEGKSPFDLPPGKCPSFDSDKSEEEACKNLKIDAEDNQTAQCDRKIASELQMDEKQGSSLVQRMGSLLRLDPSLSMSRMDRIPTPQPSISQPEECRNEASMKISSSLSLINSGSLKDLLLVLNQSGNFSVFKKEGSEDEEIAVEPQLADGLTFASYEDRAGEEPPTPTFYTAGRSLSPFGSKPRSAMEYPTAFLNGAASTFRRRSSEMEDHRASVKKQRT